MKHDALRVANPLSFRLLRRILGASAVVLLLLAGARAWWEYRSDLGELEEQFAVIEKTAGKALASALWAYDRQQLQDIAEGLRTFRHINHVAVRDKNGMVAQAGGHRTGDVREREMPLVVEHEGKALQIGTLHLQADLAEARGDAVQVALLSLAFSSILATTVAGVIFWLTSSMVSRHLAVLAGHLRGMRLSGRGPRLALDKADAGDELDVLARAVNEMQDSLETSMQKLLAAQAEARSWARFPQENPLPVLRAGADGVVMKTNPASAALFEELGSGEGKPLPEPFTAEFSRAMAEGALRHFEVEVGGRTYTFALRPLPAEGYANLYGLDITDRVRAEAEKREGERLFRAMVEAVPVAIWHSAGPGAAAEYINPAFERLLGYGLADFPDENSWWSKSYPDPDYRREVRQEWARRVTEANASGQSTEPLETVCACKDGSRKTIAWTYIPLGGSTFTCGVDVTDARQAQEALKRQVVALTQPLDATGAVPFPDLFNLEDIQRIQDSFSKAMNVASIITTPDGTPITRPSNFCRLCSEVIRKTEKGLANCYASDAVLGRPRTDGPTVQPCLSGGLWDAGASITVGGRHVANWLIGQVRNEAQNEEAMLAYADEIGADRQAFREALAEVPMMSAEQFRRVAQALHLMSSELSLRAYQNMQQARFIHARQLAEEELTRSEARIRALFDATSDSAILMDAYGVILAVNARGAGRRGLRPEQMLGASIYAHLPAEGAAQRRMHTEEAIASGRPQAYEEVRGHDHYAINIYPIPGPDGAVRQLASFSRDITLQKNAEASLRRALRRLQGLVRVLQHESSSIQEFLDFSLSVALELTESRLGYIYHYDEATRRFVLNTWSHEVMDECRVPGRPTVYELDKTGIWGEVVRQRRPMVVNDFAAAHPLKRGYPEGHVHLTNFMSVPVFSEGRIVAVAGVANRQGDYDGAQVEQLTMLMNACWQVVGRMDAERTVLSERQFTDAVLDSVPGLVYLYDAEGRLVRWNRQHESLTGYSREELAAMRLLDWYKDDPESLASITGAVERVMAEGAGEAEAMLQTRDGRRIPYYFTAVSLEIDGRPYFAGIGIDITERRKAEDEIRRSLHEKEIMLKEIHHRVKNNLQIISSLLFLQSEHVESDADREKFQESQKRISAMALVHEELYGSADLSSVDMAEYITRLVDRLAANADVPVTVEYALDEVLLPVTRSIPCGLALNEMVMNAVKHACRHCPNGGQVRVILSRQEGALALAVEDNGPGLPPDFDMESPETLGLTLITSLARQLGGSATAADTGHGARFSLRFPEREAP